MNKNFDDWLQQQLGLKTATPTYPTRDAMTVEQARERVASDFDALIREAEEWWNPNAFERFARKVLNEGKAPPPPVHAQRSPTGVGKTQIGARVIAADRRARRAAGDDGPMATRPWGYFGPTHRLNDSTAKQFREAGLTAQVYRGRFALDPDVPGNEERPESEQVLMCLAPERVRQAMSLYQSISESCCKSKKQECAFFNECAFQRQLRGPAPDVWLAAHEMIFHDQPALSELAGVIVDETFYQDGLSGIEEPREALTLDEIAVLGDGVDDPHLALKRERLVEILREHPLGGLRRDHLIIENKLPDGSIGYGHAIYEKLCTDAIRSEWRIFSRLEITPGMTEEQIDKLKEIIPDCVRARRMVSVWGALREMLEEKIEIREGIEVREGIEISGRLILARKDGKTILRVRGVRPVLDAREVPSMLLDATLPSELILKKFYPQVKVISDVQVEMPYVRVRQVLGAPVSQNKLWGGDLGAPDPVDGRRHRQALRRYLLARWLEIDGPGLWLKSRPRRPMVVICQKRLRGWLKESGLPEGIALEHYNAIAGLDDHKHVRLLVTIGRTLPPPAAVEAISGALTGAQPALEAPTGRGYGRVPRALRMAAGGGIEVENCSQHVDPVAEAVRWQVCEAELVQAIGRGRGVNRTAETPLDVDVLGDVVLPVTVDEALPWEEPSELVEPLALHGLVTTSPADLARVWPRVWPNVKAADRTLARARAGGSKGQNPI
jgi:hypothetical protein